MSRDGKQKTIGLKLISNAVLVLGRVVMSALWESMTLLMERSLQKRSSNVSSVGPVKTCVPTTLFYDIGRILKTEVSRI